MMNPILLCHWNIHLRKIISKFHSTDGQEALDILEKQFPDVIIRCNDAHGWWFCHIRTNKKNERCDIASHFSRKNKEKDKKGLSLANLYDTKPFSKKISGTSTGIR
jgi:hypothetical protein